MVFVIWHTRPKHEVVDVSTVYAGAPTWFSIKLHHDGKLTKLPDIKYIGGEVRYVDYVDIDEFSVHELDVIMLDLGYPDPQNSEFADESQLYTTILGYLMHGKTNLLTYFMSPNAKGKVVIEELPENDDQGAGVEGQVHADSPMKNVNHGNGEPIGEFTSLVLFGSKNDSFSPEYRRGRVGNSNIGESSCSKRLNLDYIDEGVHISKEKNDDHDGSTDVQEAATCVILVRWMMLGRLQLLFKRHQLLMKDATTPLVNNDDEQLNKLFDNLMENLISSNDDNADYEGDGESEEGNQEYEEDDESQESDPNFEEYDESENNDPEYEEDERQIEDEDHMDDIMDVDNNIQDVDVDMGDFTLNVESDVEGSCINVVHGHEHEDIEVINNEEFKSLDEGSDQDRERRALIKNLRKEQRCSLGEVHKQSFSVGDKFNSKKELNEAIDLHALESRRNRFFKKNDNVRLRAQCRGVVPVTNKGQVGSQATTSKIKGKELMTPQ
ncbi:unnamed protein product [Lactuca saligna]|uniref:PB1-like domain-containing protein n=1 Tax=Lactuca saligna TaxID=75948 RepID=A0AA36EH37_LACSI|nr:unnamed protein product [Lactuca saligna]